MSTAPRARPTRPADAGADALVPMQLRIPGHLARRFHRIHVALTNEALAAEGLTAASYAALATIGRAPGITQRTLAGDGGLDAVTTGQIVDELVRRELARRVADAHDRRAWRLELTEKGKQTHERAAPAAQAAQQRMLAVLSHAEVAKLQQLLALVIDANATYDRPGAGRRAPAPRKPDATP